MSRFWKQGVALAALAVAAGVWCLSPSLAKPPKPGGGGGLANPAWVIMDGDSISRLRLLSSDGLSQQDVVRAKAFHGMKAPTWSPDDNWIAFLKGEDSGRSLRIIRPDGTGEKVIFLYANGNAPVPEWMHGMQWVPGKSGRVVYQGSDYGLYVISTLDENPAPQLILPRTSWLSGVSLSPDLSSAPGYQGAIAFVLDEGSTEYRPVLTVARAEDGEAGLEVDTSTIVQALTLPDGISTPSWSHDGREIAFLYHNFTYPGHGNSLRVLPVLVDTDEIRLDEDNVRTIYNSALVDLYGSNHAVINRPCWSPDDSLIGFCAVVGAQTEGGWAYDLFWAHSDGTGAVNVTNGSMRPMFVDWNPNWISDLH